MADMPINPQATLKFFNETMKAYRALGVNDPEPYLALQKRLDAEMQKWAQDYVNGGIIRGYGQDAYQDFVRMGEHISQDLEGQATALDRRQDMPTMDSFVATTPQEDTDYLNEIYGQVQRGDLSTDEAMDIIARSGRFDKDIGSIAGNLIAIGGMLSEEQKAELDAIGQTVGDEGETEIPAPGFGDDEKEFKPFEDVASDRTSPEDEFGRAYAQFTRQLSTSLEGKAPQIAALGEKYQDLYNAYLGEIEQRKTRGEEDAGVFKDEFVNIGKSTDPQFDQRFDRMQLVTKRPTLSAFDFLLKNVDPEDVLASTEPRRRAGGSTGGYTGFVRRLGG